MLGSPLIREFLCCRCPLDHVGLVLCTLMYNLAHIACFLAVFCEWAPPTGSWICRCPCHGHMVSLRVMRGLTWPRMFAVLPSSPMAILSHVPPFRTGLLVPRMHVPHLLAVSSRS